MNAILKPVEQKQEQVREVYMPLHLIYPDHNVLTMAQVGVWWCGLGSG